MNKKALLCSTGTMVGRSNGYNYVRAMDVLHDLCGRGVIDGGELMMLKFYYDRADGVADAARERGIPFPVFHCDKELGSMLSYAGRLKNSGRKAEADEVLGEVLRLFALNCNFCERIGCGKMVLHLWGGADSDSHIKYNISHLSWFIKEAEAHGVRLMIENVPCTTHDPLSNWRRAVTADSRISLIYDTRFAAFHRQSEEILTDRAIGGRISHVHVSDLIGEARDFSSLRPILHPTEGIVDLPAEAARLSELGYEGAVTLESPVMEDDGGLDVEKLERSLIYVRNVFGIGGGSE